MTRQLALVGLIATAFGLGSYRVLGTFSVFSAANLLLGFGALALALLRALRRLGDSQQPALRRPAARALASAFGFIVLATLIYQLAALSQIRFDWTFEGRFELAQATRQVLARLPERLAITLYSDAGDPRIRNTLLLLQEMARGHNVLVEQKRLAEHPEDEDRYGIGSSNSVLLQLGTRWELVERPTEGALYEGIARLVEGSRTALYVSVGAGEGDLERRDDLGYSGLRAALETEGYALRPLPLAIIDDIPSDAAALLLIAPRRRLSEPAVAAVARFVEAGGNLVAFVEPGVESGIEALLARYGLATPDALVIDPDSDPLEGGAKGLDPIAHEYADHPVTHGLGHNRMTFFRRARSFTLHKAKAGDRLRGLVFTGAESWLYPMSSSPPADRTPERPADAESDYRVLVASAEIERGSGRTRLLAFGDATFASNRYLRALYNLDLVVNAIHWTVEREAAISLRPKSGGRQLVQFPVPLQHSLQALYGVGLLVPELLLLAGGLIWLRLRRA